MKRAALLLLGLALALPLPAQAQSMTEKRATIDHLLDELKKAPAPEVAAPLEERLFHAWLDTTTAAVKLLIMRGQREMKAGAHDDAIQTLDDAVILDPNLAEAWHQRAIAKWQSGDTTGAIRDLEQTLRLEPRDFTAFRTLSSIAAAREDWKSAYNAWVKMLELDPKAPGGEDRLKDLKRKAFGEDT